MALVKLTYRESLRDIEACLRSAQRKVYHMGIRGKVSCNTLAHRNRLHGIRRTDPYTDVTVNTKLFLDAWRLTFLLSSDGSERAIFHTEAAGDTLLLVNPMHGSTPLGAV